QHGNSAIGEPGCRVAYLKFSIVQCKVAGRMMWWVVYQHQVGEPGYWPPERGEIVVRPDIPIDHGEGFIAQQRQRTMNAATGFQGLALGGVTNTHIKTFAVAQVGFDLLTQPGVIDDQISKTRSSQGTNVIFDQRYAARAHQRLGRM